MVFDGAPGGESARRGKLERDTFTLTETTQLTHQELGGLYSVPSLCLYGHADVTFSCASWPTASIRSTSYWKWFSLRTFFCTECSWSLNGCGTERLCYVCAHPQYPMRTYEYKSQISNPGIPGHRQARPVLPSLYFSFDLLLHSTWLTLSHCEFSTLHCTPQLNIPSPLHLFRSHQRPKILTFPAPHIPLFSLYMWDSWELAEKAGRKIFPEKWKMSFYH